MTIFRAGVLGSAILVAALALSSCGGGGGGGDSGNAGNNPSTVPQPFPGGTVAEPALMSLDNKNAIKADAFENYFKVTVSAGDTVIIRSTLQNALDDTESLRCSMSSNYAISISSDIGSCSLNFKHTFVTGGVYTFHFKYPLSNYGYFNAAIIPAGAIFTPVASASGRPDSPRSIIIGGADNALSENDFFNNFAYDAQAGDTLHIQTYPDILPSSNDTLRCNMSSGKYDGASSYGVLISDTGGYSCSETFEHRFDQAGRYYLNIRFILGAKGFFRAVVVPSI